MLNLQKKTYFAIRTLQNEDILYFFTIKFAYIKKKQYLCIVIKNKSEIFNILAIRFNKQILTKKFTIMKTKVFFVSYTNKVTKKTTTNLHIGNEPMKFSKEGLQMVTTPIKVDNIFIKI